MSDEFNKNQDLLLEAEALRAELNQLMEAVAAGDAAAIKAIGDVCEAARSSVAGLQSSAGFTISTGRHTPVNCSLPNHNHPLSIRFYQCQSNASHVFCRRHSLTKCVVHGCGGNVK